MVLFELNDEPVSEDFKSTEPLDPVEYQVTTVIRRSVAARLEALTMHPKFGFRTAHFKNRQPYIMTSLKSSLKILQLFSILQPSRYDPISANNIPLENSILPSLIILCGHWKLINTFVQPNSLL